MARGVRDGTDSRRLVWEKRWGERSGEAFPWNLTEVPSELSSLLEQVSLPQGAAVDLGCGTSVVAPFLAERFAIGVGIDIATGAIRQARQAAAGAKARPSFLVGDATRLPFRKRSCALVFDRGCLQNIPRSAWPSYFREVEAVLAPGGALHLYCSKAVKQFPHALSYRGVRSRVNWLLGRKDGPQFISRAFLARMLPASMETLRLEEFPFQLRNGQARTMLHGIFLKQQDPAS